MARLGSLKGAGTVNLLYQGVGVVKANRIGRQGGCGSVSVVCCVDRYPARAETGAIFLL